MTDVRFFTKGLIFDIEKDVILAHESPIKNTDLLTKNDTFIKNRVYYITGFDDLSKKSINTIKNTNHIPVFDQLLKKNQT